ncbi:hypothetical protein [Pseudomonas sp. Q1-7]|uniref:hypothetical protein n=1 Tax=Pseudomonas sp. Q1-7 TaxID=3020843 RepID=UPI0023013E30|nr:hypothetical protein [Pseudomonas sp. Q1-7]
MNQTVLISTRPLDFSILQRFMASCLPADAWALRPESGEGRAWNLQLSIHPCSEPVRQMLCAILNHGWLQGLEFGSA